MSDRANEDDRWDRTDAGRPESTEVDPESGPVGDPGTVESYETDGGVVFFDADNPLAWMQASSAVPLKDNA